MSQIEKTFDLADEEDQLYRVVIPGAVFGVVVRDGIVIAVAPCGERWKGRPWSQFMESAGRLNWHVELVGGEDD